MGILLRTYTITTSSSQIPQASNIVHLRLGRVPSDRGICEKLSTVFRRSDGLNHLREKPGFAILASEKSFGNSAITGSVRCEVVLAGEK